MSASKKKIRETGVTVTLFLWVGFFLKIGYFIVTNLKGYITHTVLLNLM